MKGIISFFIGLSVLVLVICLSGWIFSTDFFIFEILLMIALWVLPFVVGLLVLVGIVWLLNEIFS